MLLIHAVQVFWNCSSTFLTPPSSEVGTVLQRKVSSAEEVHLFCNIFIYGIILELLFENVLNSSSRLLPKEKTEDADCTKAFFTQKEIGSCWHDLLLTNLCRLLLISLSSSQYLQTVVWSIPRKIWGKWSWQVCGSPATPLFKDKYRVCPLTVPPPFSVNSQERAADRSGVVLVASSKHLSMKQQVTGMKTFIWSKKHFAASSFAAGGQALPAASPTRLLGSLTQSAHLVRLNPKKEACSSVFLTSWLIASQLLSCRLTPSLQSLTARQHLSASLIFLFSSLVTSQCVPQHFDIPVHVDTVLWLSRLTWPSFCSLSCLRSMRTGQHGHVLPELESRKNARLRCGSCFQNHCT